MSSNFKTIVGGRSSDHRDRNNFPRGIEILLKKAKVDMQFKTLLLKNPLKAAKSIDLTLKEHEKKIIKNTPKSILETMIQNTFVPKHHVKTFLTAKTAAMLALILTSTTLVPSHAGEPGGIPKGIEADEIVHEDYIQVAEERMGMVQNALEQYKLDQGTYPSTEEWLSVSNPLDEYLPHSYLYDPWKRKFHYEAVIEKDMIVSYKLESLGEDLNYGYDNIPCPIDTEKHSF
jgi:hypothetical protein